MSRDSHASPSLGNRSHSAQNLSAPPSPPATQRRQTTTPTSSSTFPVKNLLCGGRVAPATSNVAASPGMPAAEVAGEDGDGVDVSLPSMGEERGWRPVEDGRFRIALTHHSACDDDRNVASSRDAGDVPSALTDAEPEELTAEAEAAQEAGTFSSSRADVLYNRCAATEPHIAVDMGASLVNAINSAYTSTGYPFVVTTGNARGAVYGSFVDFSNPCLSSLEMPPVQTLIVSPSCVLDGPAAIEQGQDEMETLLSIHWYRGDGLVTAARTTGNTTSGTNSGSVAANSAHARQTPPSTSAGAAGLPFNPAVARTIAHHLTQFPEGIHGINSSPALRQILVRGELPTKLATAPLGQGNAGNNSTASPARAGAGEATTASEASRATTAASIPAPGASPTGVQLLQSESNVPPPPLPPESTAPIQQTLICASTFNHVTVYVVAHQDGKLVYTAPLQSLSASIATRKVTAHQLIHIGREEVEPLIDRAPPLPSQIPPPRRHSIAFEDVPVPRDAEAVLFSAEGLRCLGADPVKRTVSAVPLSLTVEPHLLFGNQNGDIFVFSLVQERIVHHVNYDAGTANVSAFMASGSCGAGTKLVCSPVSCIAEVENGLEKKITAMIESAVVAKRSGGASVSCDDAPAVSSSNSGVASGKPHYYYPVQPSIYAVGFDNGEILLICITCERAWMLRHLPSHHFGLRPIHDIAVRAPSFYRRLWASALPPITPIPAATDGPSPTATPVTVTTLVTVDAALVLPKEEQPIAAVACNGGAITLVRLPGMEILSSVASTDYNAVGEILALQWTATSARFLLSPDILVASGEDDTMTAFQLLTQPISNALELFLPNGNGNDNASRISSAESVQMNSWLRILEKKRFHRSWVNHLSLLPIALPALASKTKVSRGAEGNGNVERLPRYLGMCLVATSYDHRASFWPFLFSGQQENHANETTAHMPSGHFGGAGGTPGDDDFTKAEFVGSVSTTLEQEMPDHYVLVDGPTAAYPLHTELVIRVAAAGGGRSFFLVSVCCRGKVKFWSVQVSNIK